MRKQTIFITTFLLFATLATPTFADYQSPSFPSCSNPQGTSIAHYDTGSHAIVGSENLVTGSDTVYKLDDNLTKVMQCFCPPTLQTNGIQTNWLNAATLSEEQKQQLLNNGWMFVAKGQEAGLANAPYIAQNTTFSCNTAVAPTALTPTPTVCLTPTPIESGQTKTPMLQQQATPSATPAPIVTAVIQAANETSSNNQTKPSSTSSNTPSTNSNSTSPSAGPGRPSTLPNTGGSIVLLEAFAAGTIFLLISFLLKKIAA